MTNEHVMRLANEMASEMDGMLTYADIACMQEDLACTGDDPEVVYGAYTLGAAAQFSQSMWLNKQN